MLEDKVKSRCNWDFSSNLLDFNKESLMKQYIQYMFNRTQQIFEYENLDDSLPKKELEFIIQISGVGVVTEVNKKLYGFTGGFGGNPNAYYIPTKFIVANPYLKFNKTLTIDEDCVLITNDSTFIGLLPMFNKYARLLAETDLSLRIATVNARIPKITSANDDDTIASCKDYFKKVEKGEEIGVVAESDFVEKSLNTNDFTSSTSSTHIKDLIELKQYLLSSWFIELGLNANYNMKRESINDSEASMNDDCLLPLIDDMLQRRKEFVDKINKMFNRNIIVNLSSSWKQIHKEYHQKEDNIDDKGDNEDVN